MFKRKQPTKGAKIFIADKPVGVYLLYIYIHTEYKEMGMLKKKNPNGFNKYKGTATERDYKEKPTPVRSDQNKTMKIKLYFSKGVELFSVQLDVMLQNAESSAAMEDTERHTSSYV